MSERKRLGSVYCMCGIEHELYSDVVEMDCAACGQHFDFGARSPNRVTITLPDGSELEAELLDFVADSSTDPEENGRKLAEAIKKLRGRTISFSVRWQPVTLSDLYRLVDWASYLHSRRN